MSFPPVTFRFLPMLRCAMLFAIGAAAILFASPRNGPQQTILLSSRRIMLDDSSRSGEVLLVNPSDKPVSYKVTLIEMQMDESGKLARLPVGTTSERSLKPLLKFAPQQVTVGAHGAQKIRVAVGPNKLQAGEYRTHLQVAVVPSGVESTDPDPSRISIRFRVVPAISIPVLFRAGNPTASATLANGSVIGNQLHVELCRTGERSIRGDLAVYVESNEKRREQVGLIRDLTVYYPNSVRKVVVPLKPIAKATNLRVEFSETRVKNPAKAGLLVRRKE